MPGARAADGSRPSWRGPGAAVRVRLACLAWPRIRPVIGPIGEADRAADTRWLWAPFVGVGWHAVRPSPVSSFELRFTALSSDELAAFDTLSPDYEVD